MADENAEFEENMPFSMEVNNSIYKPGNNQLSKKARGVNQSNHRKVHSIHDEKFIN